MNLLPSYQTLITSPEQLALCAQATSVAQLLQQLKHLWHQEALTDNQLLDKLAACNQQILDIDMAALSGCWLPYRYHAKTHSMQWCLPLGHASEPFHDQYIERCRQQRVINQLINPKTSVRALLSAPIDRPRVPTGFIFHLSRCGSTLVSGCIAELNNTSVLSESSLLTEVLLDFSLTPVEKQQLLPQLIHLQGNLSSGRDKIIVKWNAWDLLNWSIIDAAFAQVPVLLLVRNPIEVLASHQRMSGRHMAGDPSLAELSPVFTACTSTETLLDVRIRVLRSLLSQMLKIQPQLNAKLVDYLDLTNEKIHELAKHFSLFMDKSDLSRAGRRMKFHSKVPDSLFYSDAAQKRQVFKPHEQEKILLGLNSAYEVLISKNNLMGSAHVG